MKQTTLKIIVACLLFGFSAPAASLVEPEVEAWGDFVASLSRDLSAPGSEVFISSVTGLGDLASSLASAPLSDLMTELEQRRSLRFKYFTPWHVKDKQGLREFIRRQLEKDYTPEKIASEEAILKSLGLVPLDFEVMSFLEDLLTDAVAGVYDPETDQFFLVDMDRDQRLGTRLKNKGTALMLGNTAKVIIIHELDHALGGQHFPFKETFTKLLKNATLDQQLAVMALVEGDATFVMIDHQAKNPPALAGSKTFLAGTDALTDLLVKFPLPLPGMGKFSKAPLFYQKSLIFPYYTGAEFVSYQRMFGRDGWKSVNRIYSDLPHSTEQIFHPDRYSFLVREPDIPDFSKLPDPFGPWEKIKDETGGEFLVRIVLEQYGVSDYAGAADGWHGDRLRVFRHKKTGALGFYWAIRWDDKLEAVDFYNSLGSHLPFVVELKDDVTIISLAFKQKELQTLHKKVFPQMAVTP